MKPKHEIRATTPETARDEQQTPGHRTEAAEDICGESIEAMHPLFQTGEGGSLPTSPLQLEIGTIPIRRAIDLNRKWHSRLPEITNRQACLAFGAVFDGAYYATAIWGPPIAREYNGRGYFELRRMAIANTAPRYTASRMLRVMRLLLGKLRPDVCKLISYQDTEVHAGTIYRAAGWKPIGIKKNIGTGWNTRDRPAMQTAADKIRWEFDVSYAASPSVGDSISANPKSLDLFAGTA